MSLASDGIYYEAADPSALIEDGGFATLYERSFPAEEREPLTVIWGSVARGVGVVLRARVDGETVGFITLHLIARPAVAFVVYLAVHSDWRRKHIGSSLLEHAWQAAQQHYNQAGGKLIASVWEVDPPPLAADAAERNRRGARVVFFAANGGKVISETYLQPPVNGDTPVPMWLMARVAPAQHLPAASEIIRGIYFEKYGTANGLDRGMLADLFTRVTIKQQPPSELT
jgi:GNAT superfamily N-acetyltransferase